MLLGGPWSFLENYSAITQPCHQPAKKSRSKLMFKKKKKIKKHKEEKSFHFSVCLDMTFYMVREMLAFFASFISTIIVFFLFIIIFLAMLL
jgi:hypothetical protein